MVLDIICLLLSGAFFWSTLLVVIGLLAKGRTYPQPKRQLRFAVLICARNEEKVIRLPVRSALHSGYPADKLEVIVIADNCVDGTVAAAREGGATVWEKTTPSSGKGDVLQWGIARVLADDKYDAIAVFDADNVISVGWFDCVNSALLGGESVVTGRRQSSNSRANIISGWYTIYWDMMNELSNRVRSNLGLSGKLTGTGFAFLKEALPAEGWRTHTLVEDVEFSVQHNLRGGRIAYLADADYLDEQPETVPSMWRQLRRWTTGGWQVMGSYSLQWVRAMLCKPSCRLFDCYFAIVTGISVAFIHFFNVTSFIVKLLRGAKLTSALPLVVGVFGFIFVMSWLTGALAVRLSPDKRSPRWLAIVTFPVFSLILSASVLFTLVFPTRNWKPISHRGTSVR